MGNNNLAPKQLDPLPREDREGPRERFASRARVTLCVMCAHLVVHTVTGNCYGTWPVYVMYIYSTLHKHACTIRITTRAIDYRKSLALLYMTSRSHAFSRGLAH